MAIPNVYSIDLPERCTALLQAIEADGQTGLSAGNLTTTATLACAMCAITVPYERLLSKKAQAGHPKSELSSMPKEFQDALDKRVGDGLGWMEGRSWGLLRQVQIADLANGIGDRAATCLGADAARTEARSLKLECLITTLRHALAHAHVVYLNSNGQYRVGDPAEMLLFVDYHADRPGGSKSNGAGKGDCDVLRVSERDLRCFLRKWVGLLKDTNALASTAA